MNLKKISAMLAIVFTSYSLASCNSPSTQNSLPVDNTSNISSKADTAEDVIRKFGETYAAVKDFTGVVTISDSKTGNPNDATVGDSSFAFKKDRNERVQITKSTDASKVGTVVAYRGGDKVQVLLAKPIPILGKKFTLSVNDKRIGTSRGISFDQLDITAMLNRFNKAGVKLDLVSKSNKNGRSLITISGKGTFKGLDNEVTEEILTLDSTTMFPVEDSVMVKDKTVLKISLTELKTNVGLKDDLFVL